MQGGRGGGGGRNGQDLEETIARVSTTILLIGELMSLLAVKSDVDAVSLIV